MAFWGRPVSAPRGQPQPSGPCPPRADPFSCPRTLLAVPVAARLDAFGLAWHLRIVGRIGHVVRALPLVELEQRLQGMRPVVDGLVEVAELGEAGRHGGNGEVLGLN